MCGFTDEKPVILVIGGSLGAVAVNEAVRAALPELLKQFQIIHLCGKGKVDHSLKEIKGYCQFEYIKTNCVISLLLQMLLSHVPVRMQSVNCLLLENRIF